MGEMEHYIEGSSCGRYVYGIIIDSSTGEEIDRYLYEDMMETIYGGGF